MRSSIAVSFSVVAGLAVALISPISASAAPALTVRDSLAAPTQQAASRIAAAYDHEVVVDAYTDETTLVTAQPDGTFRFEGSSTPQRVEQDGDWVPIDTELAAVDGGFSPAATTVPVVFGDGASGELARIQSPDGTWVSEELPGFDVPAPSVDGATATYADVLPGVDLRLTANADGMSEVIVIDSAAAAANPRLDDLRFAVDGAELSATAGGGTVADTGDALLTSSTSTWWDSAADGSSAASPDPTVALRPVDRTVDGDEVALDIDQITQTEDVTYPLFVDPDWSSHANAYWYIDSAYPGTSYLNGAQGTTQEKVGYISSAYTGSSDGLTHKARAYWRINTSALKGAEIYDGDFNTTEVWSFNCTASRVDLYLVSTSIPVGGTWNQIGTSYLSTAQGNKTVAYGNSSACPAHAVGFDALNAATWASNTTSNYTYFGLKAHDETSSTGWKGFSPTVTFVVDFNFAPDVPADPQLSQPQRGCGTATDPVVVDNALQDTILQTTTHDKTVPGGAAENVEVAYTLTAVDPVTANVPTVSTHGPQVQGDYPGTITAGDLDDDATYSWTAIATDSGEHPLSSAPSEPCYIHVDNTAPDARPAMTIDTTDAMVGHALDVTFSAPASSGIVEFMYWWSSEADTIDPVIPSFTAEEGELPPCGSAQGIQLFVCADDPHASVLSTTVSVAPVDRDLTLWVVGYDAAAHLGENGGHKATGVHVAADYDDRVTYASGHSWTADGSSSATDDLNQTSPRSLTNQTDTVLGLNGYEFPGYTDLNRYRQTSPNKYWASTDGTKPATYAPNAHVTELAPSSAYPTTPSDMWRICLEPSQNNTVLHAIAGNCTAGQVDAGLTWKAVPPNTPWTYHTVARCLSGTGSTQVSWILGTNGDTCSSGTYIAVGYGIHAGGASTTDPVLSDSSGSFTVSAKLTPTPGTEDRVALSGHTQTLAPYSSTWTLGMTGDNRWKFCVDTDCALSKTVAVDNSSVQITAVRDAVNRQLRIYLGASATPDIGVRTAAPGVASVTRIQVGSALSSGLPISQWGGSVTSISVLPGVVSGEQLSDLNYGAEPRLF